MVGHVTWIDLEGFGWQEEYHKSFTMVVLCHDVPYGLHGFYKAPGKLSICKLRKHEGMSFWDVVLGKERVK